MRLIGITGGISTGKTTVSNYLKENYQFPIWDADIYAREAVEPGSPILSNIVERYGSELVLSDGNLDRRKLGEIVFNDPGERRWLEGQIHPFVGDRFSQNIERLAAETRGLRDRTGIMAPGSGPTAVLTIPLLFEVHKTDLVTEIWVVYLRPELQIERLMQRDRLSREEAIARINAQMPLEEKCQKADVVLDNSSTRVALLEQIDLALARVQLPKNPEFFDETDPGKTLKNP